jgi:hypothetical protein
VVAAANDLQASSIVRVETQPAGSAEAPCREREVTEPMNETGASQSGYGVFGIRPITEFARNLLETPRPPGLVEQKADHGVVDLVLREPGAALLRWNTLMLHGKVRPFLAGPGRLPPRRGTY